MKRPQLKCSRQPQALRFAALICLLAGGSATLLTAAGPAPLSAKAAAAGARSQAGVSLPADVAFSTKLGVFASGPPCDQRLASLNSPQWLWPGCAGPTTLPIPGT